MNSGTGVRWINIGYRIDQLLQKLYESMCRNNVDNANNDKGETTW